MTKAWASVRPRMKASGATSISPLPSRFGDLVGRQHVVQRVVERAQVGIDLLAQVAGQEAQPLAGLDRGTRQDDAVDLAAHQHVDRRRPRPDRSCRCRPGRGRRPGRARAAPRYRSAWVADRAAIWRLRVRSGVGSFGSGPPAVRRSVWRAGAMRSDRIDLGLVDLHAAAQPVVQRRQHDARLLDRRGRAVDRRRGCRARPGERPSAARSGPDADHARRPDAASSELSSNVIVWTRGSARYSCGAQAASSSTSDQLAAEAVAARHRSMRTGERSRSGVGSARAWTACR